MILTKMLSLIINRDTITNPSALKLHFDGDVRLKNLIGGILSVIIDVYVSYIAITKFIDMVTFSDPTITQLHEALQDGETKI